MRDLDRLGPGFGTGNVLGRVLVGDLETLSTKAIAVLVADLKQEHVANQPVEAARRTIELFVQERLAREQTDASENLTKELIATQISLAAQGKAWRRLTLVVSALAAVVVAASRFISVCCSDSRFGVR